VERATAHRLPLGGRPRLWPTACSFCGIAAAPRVLATLQNVDALSPVIAKKISFVDFVFVTNAKAIKMSVFPYQTVSFTAAHLDDDGSLNFDADSKEGRLWKRFLAEVRGNVRIKFLFTR
jgi:hypothetical protein